MIYSQFKRTDYSDNASEILSLVRFDDGGYGVQVTTPDGDDLVGVYDLDGDKINGPCDWELVPAAEVPAEHLAWSSEWETGSTTVVPVGYDAAEVRVNTTNGLNGDTLIDTEEAAKAFALRFGESNLTALLRECGVWRDCDSYLELLAWATALRGKLILG